MNPQRYINAVDSLTWNAETNGDFHLVYASYISRLRNAFAALAARDLERSHLAKTVLEIVRYSDCGDFDNFLTVPWVSNLLLSRVIETHSIEKILRVISRRNTLRDAYNPSDLYSFSIDFSYREMPDDGFGETDLELSISERARVLREIDNANFLIQEASIVTKMFVQQFLRVVALRRDPASPEIPGSFSRPDYLGLATIINPDCKVASYIYLADAIVHEAVHSYIYMIELESGDNTAYEHFPLVDREIISPWSHKRLKIRYFVHACFVWYSLLNFWNLVVMNSRLCSDEAIERRHLCAKGFSKSRLADLVRNEELPQELKAAIDLLDERAMNRSL